MLTVEKATSQSEVVRVDVFTWTEDNLYKIKGHARKYLHYSPYDLDEFIQAAYECALQAEADTDYDFERSFWYHYKKTCIGMTYTKGQNIPCFHEEYLEEWGDDDTPPTITPQESISDYSETYSTSLDEPTKTLAISSALSLMSAKEREVWELLLTGYSPKKIANRLGKSKTAVLKLRDAGSKRVRVLLEKGGELG